MDKKAILLVAFGTSVPEARVALDNIEAKVREAFPQEEVRWAYTSSAIRNKIAKEQNLFIDAPLAAFSKLRDEGFNKVAALSLHVFPGQEFMELESEIKMLEAVDFKGKKSFDKLVLSKTLLHELEDYKRAGQAIKGILPDNPQEEALVLMGHGTHHRSFSAYGCFNDILRQQYWKQNVYMSTVEGYPELSHTMREMADNGVKKVKLAPFMIVAGDHALNDMAGDAPDSWKSVLTNAGYQVTTHMEGLGQNDAIVAIMVDHLKEAWGQLE